MDQPQRTEYNPKFIQIDYVQIFLNNVKNDVTNDTPKNINESGFTWKIILWHLCLNMMLEYILHDWRVELEVEYHILLATIAAIFHQ